MTGPLGDSSSRLAILADGGALRDLNSRLRSERLKVDFNSIPSQLADLLSKDIGGVVEPNRSTQVFFTLGSAGAGADNFIRSIEETWLVRELPLSFCRYERAESDVLTKDFPRIRFHALISYYIGLAAAFSSQSSRKGPVVAVVSDDAHLVPILADANKRGLRTLFAWFDPAPGDLAHFAARNNVEVKLIAGAAAPSAGPKEEVADDLLTNLFR